MLRRPRSPRALIIGVAMLSLLGLSLGAAPATATTPAEELGVYRGARNVSGVQQFESWLGRDVGHVVDFLGGESWQAISDPSWWANGWAGTGYQVTYSVPIIPDTGGTLQAGAAGSYNQHFVKLAQRLVAGGQADAIVRLGWEFNGDWYRWSAEDDPAAFAAYWRQIVDTMRGVPGQRFAFEWNPNLGPGSVQADLAYPGDAYVDYIGLDVYDQSWIPGYKDPAKRWQDAVNMPYGLKWHREFAAAHGKPVTFPEWGLAIRDDGHGGGDAPYFIERMHEWLASSNVAYHAYFEYDAPDGQHRLTGTEFPNAAERFRALFGPDVGGEPETEAAAETRTRVKRRAVRRGAIKGEVVRAASGRVAIRLDLRRGGGWRRAGKTSESLNSRGRFARSLRSFETRELRGGVYRVRAKFTGTSSARPSQSRFHRFSV